MITLILILFAGIAGWWLHSEFGGTHVPGSAHRFSDPSHLRVRIRGRWFRFTDDQLETARARERSFQDREGA